MICSFCAKPKERVAHIITGYGTAAICNLCVDVCKTICEQQLRKAGVQEASAEGCKPVASANNHIQNVERES